MRFVVASPWVALVRKAAYLTRSVRGAFHPLFGIVMPGSKSRPLATIASTPELSRWSV